MFVQQGTSLLCYSQTSFYLKQQHIYQHFQTSFWAKVVEAFIEPSRTLKTHAHNPRQLTNSKYQVQVTYVQIEPTTKTALHLSQCKLTFI